MIPSTYWESVNTPFTQFKAKHLQLLLELKEQVPGLPEHGFSHPELRPALQAALKSELEKVFAWSEATLTFQELTERMMFLAGAAATFL